MNYSSQTSKAIRLFKQNQVDAAHQIISDLLDSHREDSYLHYLKGMILGSQFRYVEAIRSFDQAIRIDPVHASSFFEVGIIHTKLCRFNTAWSFFNKAKALRFDLPTAEDYLQKVSKLRQPSDPTLSACLIVKNEERHLQSCLKSIEAVADEIVVVDTGSEDDTISIANEFGAKVAQYEWKQDFAAARNFSKELATGDWILQIDADEELFPQDQHKVREVMHQDACNGAFVALQNRVSATFGENQPSVHYLIRLFRNREDFYFENPIHEVLRISGTVLPVDIRLLHHGYNLDADRMRSKRNRNKEILYRRLEEKADSETTLFYISMMHLGNREYGLAESFAIRALEEMGPPTPRNQHVYLMLLNNLALISLEKEDYESARKYGQLAIQTNASYLDPYYFVGLSFSKEGDLESAQEIFEEYLEVHSRITESPVFNLFASSSDTYLFQVYHALGKIYRKQKRYDEAEEMLAKAVELNCNFWLGLVDLGYLQMDRDNLQQAADYLDRAIQIAKKSPEVNEKNKLLWFDFANAVKHYVRLLKQIQKREAAVKPAKPEGEIEKQPLQA